MKRTCKEKLLGNAKNAPEKTTCAPLLVVAEDSLRLLVEFVCRLGGTWRSR